MVDNWTAVYTLVALIPNILIMLWVMARLSNQVRVVTAKLESIEREMRMVDESTQQVTVELSRLANQRNGEATPSPRDFAEGTQADDPRRFAGREGGLGDMIDPRR